MNHGGEARLVERALAGDDEAVRPLVDLLTPVVQARVARVLVRASARRCQARDLRQEVSDFTQEVFLALFEDDARALRAWDSSRGLSLQNFVGVVAEHEAISLLRSGRRNPWTEQPTDCRDLDHAVGSAASDDARVHSRELLAKLLEGLRSELSPVGLLLFQRLLVEELPTAVVCMESGMTEASVYQWRSRLGKLVRRLAEELDEDVGPRFPKGSRPSPKRTQEGAP